MPVALNKNNRATIVDRGVAHAMTPHWNALKEQAQIAAETIYSYTYGDLQARIEALPKEWFCWTDSIYVVTTDLGFKNRYRSSDYGMDPLLPLGRDRAIPPHSGDSGQFKIDKDHPCFTPVASLGRQWKQNYELESAIRNKLLTLVYSVKTVEKLAERWPEGKVFYEDLLEVKPVVHLPVDASLVKTVNKLLGLP